MYDYESVISTCPNCLISAAPVIILLWFYELWTIVALGLNPQAHAAQPGVEIWNSGKSVFIGGWPGDGYHPLATPAAQTCCTNTVWEELGPPYLHICLFWLAHQLFCLWLPPSPHPPHTLENTGYLSTYHKPDVLGQGWKPDWALNWISSGLWGEVARTCKIG